MIPASMGLRFQVPADLETFTVTASWGVYRVTGHRPGECRPDGRSATTSAPRSSDRSPSRSPT